jgi:hypothetical protein
LNSIARPRIVTASLLLLLLLDANVALPHISSSSNAIRATSCMMSLPVTTIKFDERFNAVRRIQRDSGTSQKPTAARVPYQLWFLSSGCEYDRTNIRMAAVAAAEQQQQQQQQHIGRPMERTLKM